MRGKSLYDTVVIKDAECNQKHTNGTGSESERGGGPKSKEKREGTRESFSYPLLYSYSARKQIRGPGEIPHLTNRSVSHVMIAWSHD